ncbi:MULTISPECIES: GntR family transcriptional regulator [Streptomyces]|uniref:GntR family transcriptional regulator n=1 Tax=Streptomyces TaxID=1883 RepID=UPI002010138A|nr:winged helix-turn-helix domain-containing protein [Streptomyces sp. LRE541]UPZ29867.1 GntR family transcriptional regulator [Streptomyces sp. LRE541]
MDTSRTADGGDRESTQARVERVLREQLENGTYPLQARVPPQRQLADEFGVSRDTVQRALARLTEDGLIETRRGSGTRVIRVPNSRPHPPQSRRPGSASLKPLIEQAFQQAEVSLDVATLTAETLLRHLRNQHELIADEGASAPERLRVRMLLPRTTERLAYPRAVQAEDPRIWERWRAMVRENGRRLEELKAGFLGLGVETSVDIQHIPMTPQFKLYVINDEHMLFGPYSVLRRTIKVPREGRPDEDEAVDSLDVLGLGATLSYHRLEADDRTHDSVFFSSMKDWFSSHWDRWPEVPHTE